MTTEEIQRKMVNILWDEGYRSGQQVIKNKPTDFGLVSMETMFRFVAWLNLNCLGEGIDDNTFEYVREEGVSKDLTLEELFKLFTEQSKEI